MCESLPRLRRPGIGRRARSERTSRGGRRADRAANPVARTTGLVIRELSNELVVYDTTTHRAHCLNSTAALVFQHADGSRSIDDLTALLAGAGTDSHEELVRAALARLAEAGLLEPEASAPPAPSRREVLRRIGLGAVLLAPVVTSLLVPTPTEAAATCIPETSCVAGVNDNQPCRLTAEPNCNNGRTCQGTGVCQI